MGQLMFYLAAVAACLLWSAAFVAAAARTDRTWLRRLLVAVAVVVPPLGLAPWVWVTGGLAALGLRTNWFGPTLTAFTAAVIGGLWISAAGLSRRSPAGAAAAAWPVVGLAAGCVLAKACALGTLLFIDNAVAAEGRMLRVEAAQMMAAALPPAPEPDENAAPLYRRAVAVLVTDDMGRCRPAAGSSGRRVCCKATSPAADPLNADVASPEVAAILARHAGNLELLRRATDKPGCRFDRDWSRPSYDMPLEEVQEMRHAAKVLALAVRRAAADGDGAAAVADLIRMHRLGMHAASEPLLLSGLVGQKIDGTAIGTLADVLPRLEKDDLPLLDTDAVRDFVATPIRYQGGFLGDEACGLAMLGDLADEVDGSKMLEWLRSERVSAAWSDAWTRFTFDRPFPLLYRCFLLPADIVGYRGTMRQYQALLEDLPPGQRFPEIEKRTDKIERGLRERREGIVCSFITPALSGVLAAQARAQALHGAAEVLVAATRARLQTGALPGSAADLVPERLAALPIDPFTTDAPLRSKTTDDAWVVYSVGPDGEDDGGPAPDGAHVEGNDDVGLRMAR